ncbi:hypothetical protein [Actinophytocola sediminis]
MDDSDPHRTLLALAGHAPDGWLAIARETVADGDTGRLAELRGALATVPARRSTGRAFRFTPDTSGHEEADRAVVAVVAAVAAWAGTTACWATTRDDTDRVYLVQADGDLPAVTLAVQRALTGTPRVETFGPDTPLPAYHESALLAATPLWSAAPAAPVRVARTFDGASPDGGPWFDPGHELVVDAEECQRLLDFLAGGEVVLAAEVRLPDLLTGTAGAVPTDLRSDGTWVWSAAARYYLDRHRLAPDADLAAHAATSPPGGRLSPLDRYRVRAALTPTDEETPLWRAG